MKAAFNHFDRLIVANVSPWLLERSEQSPIMAGEKQVVVLNGLDTDVFTYQEGSDLRRELGIGSDTKIVFHATPAFTNDPIHIKGGYYVLSLAQQMPDVTFVIAGKVEGDVPATKNVIFLGRVEDQQQLAHYYSMGDVTVLASKKETFSMICAESLCCGTPVVGFKAGAPERISLPEYSEFVDYADVAALEKAIRGRLAIPTDKQEVSKKAQLTYAKEHMTSSYIQLYKEILK